ncbi:MAG: omega-amidase [Saprospiraceae bacterium]|jgi:omega-amidase
MSDIEDRLRVSVIQDEISWHDPAANRDRYDKHLPDTLETDLVVLPEMFSTGFSMKPWESFETMNGKTVAWMLTKAQELDAVITGSLIMKLDDHYVNRMIWAKPDGNLSYYDKRHLFRFGKEHLHYEAGDQRVIVEHKGWRVALFICYDLRFPVWSRNQADYDLALYVANWPDARQFAWDSLLVARAIENQCYIAASNRVGADPLGNTFSGGSAILGPKGTGLFDFTDQTVLKTESLSMTELNDYRELFPAAKDADPFTLT